MRTRLIPCAALVGLFLAPGPAARADDKPAAPTLVVRVAAFDELIANARYLATLAGKGEEAKQAEKLLQTLTGPKGLEGLDTKKPLGLYAFLGPNGVDSEAVALLPIADKDAFLDLLKRLDLNLDKGEDDVYKVTLPKAPTPTYFRFANGYLYAAMPNAAPLAKKRLLAPADVLAADKVGTLSLTFYVERIPAEMKKILLGQTELRVAKFKEEKRAGETDAQFTLRKAVIDEGMFTLKAVLQDGGELNVRLDVDRQEGDLALSATFAAKTDSDLAKRIKDFGRFFSVGASLLGPDQAASLVVHLALPDKVRQTLAPVLDEQAKKELDKENNEDARRLKETLIKAALPTLQAGELDAGLSLTGPGKDGTYTVVSAVQVKEGKALEKALKELVKALPEDARNRIKVDADRVGEVNIHRLSPDKNEAGRKILGDKPVYVAIRGDAVLAAAGDTGLAALKDALTRKPTIGRNLQVEVAVHRLAPLLAQSNKGVIDAAKKAFAVEGSDRVWLALQGGPQIKLRLEVKAPIVQFLALADKARKAND
jgi:hypothetical protein